MGEETEIIVRDQENYLSVGQVKEHVERVKQILKEVMVEGTVVDGKITKDGHYSMLPGCGKRKVLLKPGAEKLCLAFNLVPRYSINILPVLESEHTPPGHRDYEVTCELFSRSSAGFVGQGMGSCTTMESKYKSRNASRICPKCQQETIFKDNKGGGWYCWAKKGGCGAKFNAGDSSIESQSCGKIPNPDIADVYNTVKKMACKRALVHAVIQCLAVGDIFMQDVEDMKPEDLNNNQPAKPEMKAPQSKSGSGKTNPAQIKAIQTLVNKVWEEAPDNVQHTGVAGLLGLDELKSYKDLTFDQASKAIEMLREEADKE